MKTFQAGHLRRHLATASGKKYLGQVRQDREDREDRQDKEEKHDKHLNKTFQNTSAG